MPRVSFATWAASAAAAADRAPGLVDGRRSKSRQRIDAPAQVIRERLSVFDRRKRGEGDRRADRNRQRRAYASLDFMEDERKPDCLTHVARNLE
jgi:hypothetical protein